MQNRDGGWGAFDRECDNEILTWIPFADHNAMIDPSCEDITGRTLDALERLGHSPRVEPRRWRGASTFLTAQAGVRRDLVRALGLQLHLRNLARAARA